MSRLVHDLTVYSPIPSARSGDPDVVSTTSGAMHRSWSYAGAGGCPWSRHPHVGSTSGLWHRRTSASPRRP